jgi:glycosyltransferase involved in cell wall biosynthesis
MNILQVGLRDLIGQRFNGYQLHRALAALGHESHMLVVEKRSQEPSVKAHSKIVEILDFGIFLAERVSSLQGLLSPIGFSLPFRRCFRRADVVHWHLVNPHYISLPSMPLLTRLRPTVWSLHDPSAITGHCVHPLDCQRWRTGCGKCPDLSRNFTVWFDTTALVWRVKRAAYHRSSFTLIVASQWMKKLIQASPLLSSFPCYVIPYGLDLNTWRRLDRSACRARLGIPAEAKVIAFRMPRGGRQRELKGIPCLLEALERLQAPEPTYLLALEDTVRLADLTRKYRIIELGWIEDESRLVEALTAADVFLMPSLAEAFGLMAVEAMACGTAAIVSDDSALPEAVRAPEAGLVVPPRDAEALAQAIGHLLNNDTLRTTMGMAGRRIVESEYSFDRYVQRHLELYESLAKRERLK